VLLFIFTPSALSGHWEDANEFGFSSHVIGEVPGGAKRTYVFEMGSSRESFFLWGYLKSKVYVRKPHKVDDLKVSIREEIATVPQEMLNF